MTRLEVADAINTIIQEAVRRSGGHTGFRAGLHWKRSYKPEVDQIFAVMGRLSPEPKPKPQVPELPPDLLKKAQRLKERFQFTDEQARAARDILRGVDLYE